LPAQDQYHYAMIETARAFIRIAQIYGVFDLENTNFCIEVGERHGLENVGTFPPVPYQSLFSNCVQPDAVVKSGKGQGYLLVINLTF